MTLNIQDPETEQLAHSLARQTGESVTVAMRRALEERMRCLTSDIRKAALLEDLAASRRRWSKMPILDHRNTNDIIGYDENGIPS